MGKYECITTCIIALFVLIILLFAVKGCVDYSIRRMELGYPESYHTPVYPKGATNG